MQVKSIIKNKGKLIGVIIGFILILGSIKLYDSYQSKKIINNYSQRISEINKNFDELDKRNDKLDKLKQTIDDYDQYKKTGSVFDEVLMQYENVIANMKKFFIDDYDNSIENNTLKDVDNIKDKNQLISTNENLINVFETIKNEENLVLTSEQVKKYEACIDSLSESYKNRLKVIEEAEKREEEERKAKEEEERKVQENISNSSVQNNDKYSSESNNNSNSSIKSSSSSTESYNNSSSNSEGSWNSGMNHAWDVDPNTGEKIHGSDTFFDSKGNVYDKDGNFLYNLNDWG